MTQCVTRQKYFCAGLELLGLELGQNSQARVLFLRKGQRCAYLKAKWAGLQDLRGEKAQVATFVCNGGVGFPFRDMFQARLA